MVKNVSVDFVVMLFSAVESVSNPGVLVFSNGFYPLSEPQNSGPQHRRYLHSTALYVLNQFNIGETKRYVFAIIHVY